jgi:Zn-dependent peptidase ImmA (M78 family)/DNA-binding XRE family transcriptional regulator
MAMPRSKKESLPTNPHVLRWAREYAGLSEDEAAEHLNVPRSKIANWETPDTEVRPTVNQARKLAGFYGRGFLEFFLDDPPPLVEPKLIPDFRLYAHAANPSETRALKDVQLWAEAQRTNALDLYEELAEEPPPLNDKIFASTKDDAEKVATSAREAMGYPIEAQVGLPIQGRSQIPGTLRDKIEQLGILTLKRSDVRHWGVRGFCIAENVLPVILFSKESPNAQAFTLGHELAHVLIQQSAISGSIPKTGGEPKAREIEEWCDRFAAALLMPADKVGEWIKDVPVVGRAISDENLLAAAEYFGVSRHAMCIRLMHLGYVSQRFYWEDKKPQFDEEERRYRSFGRPKFYGRRYVGSLGNLYTSLVIEAWNGGRITNHTAAEFMGISNFVHLKNIRDDFGK